MKISYLLRRLKFRLSNDGFRRTLKELFYFNREAVIVQKDLASYDLKVLGRDFVYVTVDKKNSVEMEEKFNLPLFNYYSKINCSSLIVTEDDNLIGFIRWTQDKKFGDLNKFKIKLEADQAYMFDFFIFPKYRGTQAAKEISYFALNQLKSKGIKKYYGYFFADNLPALWWHRAVLHAVEIKKIKLHRFLFLEVVNGHISAGSLMHYLRKMICLFRHPNNNNEHRGCNQRGGNKRRKDVF